MGVKKRFWKRVLVCAAVFLAIVLVKNLTHGAYTLDYTELTLEQLRAERPEAVLTDADLAVGEALLALPEVQTLTGIAEPVTFSKELAAETVGELLPQDAEILDFSGNDQFLFVSYQQGRGWTTLQFSLDGSTAPYKGTKVSARVYYEAMPDGTFRKNITKRDWLYFLKF